MGKSKNNKKPKNELVFDNKKREEFLKGFTKRKKQRQRVAQESIEQKLKEERKRIKLESKNLKEKYKQSFKQIDDLKDIVSGDDEEIDGVTIKISEFKEDLSKKFIGLRKVESSSSEDENEPDKNEDVINIKGMEIVDSEIKSLTQDGKKKVEQLKELKTEKDFKKLIKKQTKSALKKSKIVQMKNNLNHKRNVKLSHRKKYFKEKFLKKHKKIPKHNSNNNRKK